MISVPEQLLKISRQVHDDEIQPQETVRLLEDPKNWNNLNISIDRASFTKRLDQIREL